MKRLINTTTILSLALYVVPPFAAAQEFPKVTVDGTEVICLPNKKAECPEGAFCVVVKNEKNCEARAIEALAAAAADAAAAASAVADQAAADAAVAAETATNASNDADAAAAAATEADKAAADQAAADAAAAELAAAEKAAAEQAAADAAAAEQAAADKAARKAAKQAADEAAAAEAAAADQVAADQAAADQAAADAAAADQAAADQAAADAAAKAAADQAAADAAATADANAATETETVAPEVTTTETNAGDTTATEAGYPTVTVNGQVFICLPDKNAICPEGASCVIAKTPKRCEVKAEAELAAAAEGGTATPEETVVTEVPAEDAAAVAAAQAAAAAAAAAALADPNVEVIEAPVPTDAAIETLETALENPTDPEEALVIPEVEATPVEVVNGEPGTLPADLPPSAEATVVTEVLTEADARASTEEFEAAPTTVAPGKKTGLSDFEKVGLIALGALIVGAIINGNKQVVSNSGDRVVVRQPDGTYQVYKDDNALLREPGSTVRTETFADGSTRTIVQRTDGSQIVTIRDATGRVLQRVAYDKTGRGVMLIDDLQEEERVDVTTLPRVEPSRNQISLDNDNADLEAQLAAASAVDLGRRFSLRQIRNIQEVRWLAPTVDVNNITFETGSSAIQATEAKKLSRLGKLMTQMIERNPGEVFLIEGHTDAVGSAASNLALSDRRAESVAKALTEYFDVPPENLVVQGYGEGELKVETLGDERRNRRASVRIITSLLHRSAL